METTLRNPRQPLTPGWDAFHTLVKGAGVFATVVSGAAAILELIAYKVQPDCQAGSARFMDFGPLVPVGFLLVFGVALLITRTVLKPAYASPAIGGSLVVFAVALGAIFLASLVNLPELWTDASYNGPSAIQCPW